MHYGKRVARHQFGYIYIYLFIFIFVDQLIRVRLTHLSLYNVKDLGGNYH